MVLVKKPCIVLDMDGTLIANRGDTPYPRPYLREFLKFCFANFKQVGIWTAATSEWYEIVDRVIFQPILKKLNKKFSFVYTREKCRDGKDLLKPLANIWKRITGPWMDCHPSNTLIVEDNEDVCILNKTSTIIVPFYNLKLKDKVLKDLVIDLVKMLKNYKKNGDIRKVILDKWKLK